MFTLSQFLQMQFDHTAWAADRLRESGEPYSLNAAFVQTQTRAPGGEPFTGQAGDAAQDKGGTVAGALNRFHAETDNAANVLKTAHEALWPAAWNLRTSINDATGPVIIQDGDRLAQLSVAFYVTEDWKVVADLSRFSGSLTQDQSEALTVWQQRAQEGLDKNREALEQASDKAAADLRANVHFEQVATDGQIGSLVGETPAQAKADVKAYLAGTATPEQKARVEAATRLSDAQQRALQEGGDAKLSPEQTSVVSEMSGQLRDKSATDIRALVKDKLHGDGKAVSNALELMSDDHVASAVPVVQGDKTAPWRGGMDKLPAKVQQALRDKAALDDSHDTGHDVIPGQKYPTLDQLQALSDLVGGSDESARQGTALDKGLLDKQYEIMAFVNTRVEGHPPQVDAFLESSMRTAGADQIADHQMLDPSNPASKGYASALLHYKWDDGGAAAKEMIHHATAGAVIPDDGGSPAQRAVAERAGEVSQTFFNQLKEEAGAFKGANAFGQYLFGSLGSQSPLLTRELADDLSHYVGAAYGNELPGQHTLGFHALADDKRGDMADVIRVLATDHDAGQTMTKASYAQVIAWEQQYAKSLDSGETDTRSMRNAAELLGAVDKGTQDLGDAGKKMREDGFDAAKPWAKVLVKAIRGEAGPFGDMVDDLMGNEMKKALAGDGGPGRVVDGDAIRYQIATILIASGHHPVSGQLAGLLQNGQMPNWDNLTPDQRAGMGDAIQRYLNGQSVGGDVTSDIVRFHEYYDKINPPKK
ncbi:hypothetical protein [Segniliparus rugosus]|nr:hypothetical protein [Segniliparus rugosus]